MFDHLNTDLQLAPDTAQELTFPTEKQQRGLGSGDAQNRIKADAQCY